jgi:hypothetical protein
MIPLVLVLMHWNTLIIPKIQNVLDSRMDTKQQWQQDSSLALMAQCQ